MLITKAKLKEFLIVGTALQKFRTFFDIVPRFAALVKLFVLPKPFALLPQQHPCTRHNPPLQVLPRRSSVPAR